MAAATKLYRDDRAAERFVTDMDAHLLDDHGQITLIDISANGVAIAATMNVPRDAEVSVALPALGPRRMVVVHGKDTRLGCRFVEPLSAADLSLALDAGARAKLTPPHRLNTLQGDDRTSAAMFLTCLGIAVVVVLAAMIAVT